MRSDGAFDTSSKSIDEPAPGRSGWSVLAIDGEHRDPRCFGLVHFRRDAHQVAGVQIRVNHRNRHMAPTEPGPKKRVLPHSVIRFSE